MQKIITNIIFKKSPELKSKISIDIYSDTICPWCYIGKRKVESAIKLFPNNLFEIVWRPYQLNPNISLKGKDRQKYLSNKFGGKQQAKQFYSSINEAGKKIGIFFQFDKILKTPNSFVSHKLLALGYKKDKQNQLMESLFYAYFIEGKNIGELEELIKIAKQNNIDEQEAYKYLTSNIDNDSLIKEEEQARKMGIKGVPCFIINKHYVIFGAQETDRFIDFFKTIINKN